MNNNFWRNVAKWTCIVLLGIVSAVSITVIFLTDKSFAYISAIIGLAGLIIAVVVSKTIKKSTKKIIVVGIIIAFAILAGRYFCTACNSGESEPSETPTPETTQVPTGAPSEAPTPPPAPSQTPPTPSPDDSIGFADIHQVDEELQAELKYHPDIAQDEWNYLFFLSNRERSLSDDAEVLMDQVYQLIQEDYTRYLHTEPSCPAKQINEDKDLCTLILSAEKYDAAVKQERAAHENCIDSYKKLIEIYEEVTQRAKRGEYFLQLARPYSEIILFLPRETDEEKDYVFSCGARAVHAFLLTLTYQDRTGSSDADILYRIAQVYHCLGDTPGLERELKRELYLLAATYYENACAITTEADQYQSYSYYYAGMAWHKVGIVSTSGDEKKCVLEQATAKYKKVQEEELFGKDAHIYSYADYALEDIKYRLRFCG